MRAKTKVIDIRSQPMTMDMMWPILQQFDVNPIFFALQRIV